MERAVLAYSGGLDTSVTIRWLAEHGLRGRRGRRRRRPAGGLRAGRPPRPARRRRRGPRRRRGRPVRIGVPDEGDQGERPVRGQVPDGVRARAAAHRRRGREGRARGAGADVVAHGCTGKGNDQVRFEVVVRRARARSRGARADPRRRHPAREGDRARRGVGHPDRERRDGLLDRREPVGPHRRVRAARGSLGRRRPRTPSRAPPRRPTGPSEPAELVADVRARACPWRSTARRRRCPS